MSLKILDCTLRDGGYINNWNFGEDNIRSICRRLSSAGTDIIEMGFLTNDAKEGHSLYGNTAEIDKLAPECNGTTQIAAMIALGEKEMNPALLPLAESTRLDIVRITFHNDESEIARAVDYARCLMSKNYKVCMQPVGTTSYTSIELLRLIDRINELNPFAFYLVDTLGMMYKHDLLKMIYLIDSNLNKDIAIGFHSHNNLQTSFSNVQEILEFQSQRQFIVDGSVFGMGRGAGNLCTEIIMDYINKTYENRYDILPLLEIIDESLINYYAQNPWGYSAGYFLSAAKGCHPNYASYLLTKQTIQATQIGAILEKIPNEERSVFNHDLIDRLYISAQENHVNDSDARDTLKSLISDKAVLVLAPGKSLEQQRSEIDGFINGHDLFIVSVNFIPDYHCDAYFVSNQRRISLMNIADADKLLLTSNVRFNHKGKALVFDYSDLLNDRRVVYDNAGLMLINLLISLGVNQIYLAGFDGFGSNQLENYVNSFHMGVVEREHQQNINAAIEAQLSDFTKSASIELITKSRYNLSKG
ncbi:MAG: aldolase catalytic domain-containing protein [Oscillospiraceae bacterium]